MQEIATLLAICVLDWGYAIRAMAYTTTHFHISPGGFLVEGSPEEGASYSIPPQWHEFYEGRAMGTDFFHIIGWPRYIALTWLAWLGFGWGDYWELRMAAPPDVRVDVACFFWTLNTAIVCSAGWLLLKILHGKTSTWGWTPRWMQR